MSLADETDFPFIISQLYFSVRTKQPGGPGEVLDGESIGSCIKMTDEKC